MNNEIKDAITLLSEYCGCRTCRDCQLRIDTAGCLLGCGYPNQWVEIMQEAESQRMFHEDLKRINGAKKNVNASKRL